jgi:hypothetical protein
LQPRHCVEVANLPPPPVQYPLDRGLGGTTSDLGAVEKSLSPVDPSFHSTAFLLQMQILTIPSTQLYNIRRFIVNVFRIWLLGRLRVKQYLKTSVYWTVMPTFYWTGPLSIQSNLNVWTIC